ncbi:uncharacterized protein HMPREF1541_07300 [Cyphellophora europaea CBS 101466]|uniref:Uncharacterized protein n=1 Tax=Cyphellophora europaea (strain CBS 101466) TaxID=1220924 RepID=W2RMG3_CYPE1|nr:uncharacterized protein HMPREF1541_07300 [Cyphellophora europaea CBS 101466]ETN37677.1 hypothetical protein HMPREF1541_07300 [Cyphellophora europaea CBS 101466]
MAAFTKEEYDSGEVMDKIMDNKLSQWKKAREDGKMDSTQYKSWASDAPIARCVDGTAVVEEGNPLETFQCKNMDLHDFKSHADLGSSEGEGSSSWGWVSKDGREFAAIGQFDGTAFAEISKEGKLIYLGRLPAQSVGSFWREIRVLGDYCIIGSEAVDHNVQIFDMKKLLTLDPEEPTIFSTTDDLTGLFSENIPIGRTHNVVINKELNYAVAVGAQPRNDTCASGLIFIDMSDPANPTSPGCASSDGYVHDAECVVYRGPDKRYQGRDICYGYNEDSVTIYDVTDKTGLNASSIISRTAYEGVAYTHQGAVLDPMNQEYLLIDDELDEMNEIEPAADGYAVTYIMDIRDLENPVVTGLYRQPVRSIDHNQYVFGDYVYQSNYGAGIRVLDISSIPKDNTGAGVYEAAFFDIYPEDDAIGGIIEFVGTWSHYAGYPSGNILVNTIERGAFVVKINKRDGPEPTSTTSKAETTKTTSKTATVSETTASTSTTKFITKTTDTTTAAETTGSVSTGHYWEDVSASVSVSTSGKPSKSVESPVAPSVTDAAEWEDDDVDCDNGEVDDDDCDEEDDSVADGSKPESSESKTWADYVPESTTLETIPAPKPTGESKPVKPTPGYETPSPVEEKPAPLEETPAPVEEKPVGHEAADEGVEKPAPVDVYKPTATGEKVAEYTGAASKGAFSTAFGVGFLGLALMW